MLKDNDILLFNYPLITIYPLSLFYSVENKSIINLIALTCTLSATDKKALIEGSLRSSAQLLVRLETRHTTQLITVSKHEFCSNFCADFILANMVQCNAHE